MSEHPESTHDPLDEAIAAFQRMNVPDRLLDALVLRRLDADRDEAARRAVLHSSPAARKQPGCYGPRMRWLARSAVAAVVVLGGLGVWLLNGSAPLALADVVKAAEKHRLVRYREQEVTDTEAKTGSARDSTVYADIRAPRLYSESRLHDPEGECVMVSVHDGKRHLTSNSRQKTATLDRAPKDYKSLLCCLEEFQQKKGVAQENGRLDGRAAVKYRHVEGRQTITLWVDAKTRLPLRLEQECIDPKPGVARATLIWTDFAWDPELPAGFESLDQLFSAQPPDGYTVEDRTNRSKI